MWLEMSGVRLSLSIIPFGPSGRLVDAAPGLQFTRQQQAAGMIGACSNPTVLTNVRRYGYNSRVALIISGVIFLLWHDEENPP